MGVSIYAQFVYMYVDTFFLGQSTMPEYKLFIIKTCSVDPLLHEIRYGRISALDHSSGHFLSRTRRYSESVLKNVLSDPILMDLYGCSIYKDDYR